MNEFIPHVVEDFDPLLVSYPLTVEPKHNGWRCVINMCDMYAKTRTGIYLTTHLSHIMHDITRHIAGKVNTVPQRPTIIDGELIHPRGPREIVSICTSKSHLRDGTLRYVVFDIPTIQDTYQKRREKLLKLFPENDHSSVRVSDSSLVNSESELKEYYRESLSTSHEGVVVKDPTSCYGQPGSWMRIKPGLCPWYW